MFMSPVNRSESAVTPVTPWNPASMPLREKPSQLDGSTYNLSPPSLPVVVLSTVLV